MKTNNPTPTQSALGDFASETFSRFLDGLTSPEEERQLREALEAQASLSEEERAVLDILRLSFPEEDTAALLTEDYSADFEAMTAQTDCSRVTKSSSFFTVHPSLFIRRIAAVLSIAAVLLIAFFLLKPLSISPRVGEDFSSSAEDTNMNASLPPTGGKATGRRAPLGNAGRGAEKKAEALAEVQSTKKPVKKRRKAVRKQSTPIEEPVEEIMLVEPMEEPTIAMEPTSVSYATIEAEMLDIRSRGERLEALVADLTRSY